MGGLCNWDYCVFCGVQTVCVSNCLKEFVALQTACSMAQVVSYSLSEWRPKSDPGLVHVRHVVEKEVMGRVFLPILPQSHLSIISAALHTHHHFNRSEKWISVWSFEPSNKVIRSCILMNIGEKILSLYFCAWKNEIVLL